MGTNRMSFQTANLLITDFRALGRVPSQEEVLEKHKELIRVIIRVARHQQGVRG